MLGGEISTSPVLGNEGLSREDDGRKFIDKFVEYLFATSSGDSYSRGNSLTNGGSVRAGGSGGPSGNPNALLGFAGMVGGEILTRPGSGNEGLAFAPSLLATATLESLGITNGGSVGAGGSGGRRRYPNPFVRFLSNRELAGAGIANGCAVAGGLGASPVQSSNGSGGTPIDVGGGASPNSGHYPFGGGGGDSPLGSGGHSPFGSSGLGGPDIDDGESYPSVRSSVSVGMNEIVCIVRARGRGKHRKLRTSVKVKGEKVRQAIRFKRTNALQGLGEM